ncbi:MAG: signal peptidase II [Anaerolineales bacterium]|nr:signal peptidase II [Anaerolineales bacterium]
MFKKIANQQLVYWIGALVILIDQYIKVLVRANMPVGSIWAPTPEIAPFFRFLHIENNGAAFGMFQSGGVIFGAIAVVVSIVIAYYAARLPEGQWALRVALGLQLGGALGNLIDRVVNGPVTDFFNLMSMWNTPIFNVADLSITTGVVVLVLLMWNESRHAPKTEPDATQA